MKIESLTRVTSLMTVLMETLTQHPLMIFFRIRSEQGDDGYEGRDNRVVINGG